MIWSKRLIIKKITQIQNELLNITSLVRKIYYNTKITKVENKIPVTTGLITKANLGKKMKTPKNENTRCY